MCSRLDKMCDVTETMLPKCSGVDCPGHFLGQTRRVYTWKAAEELGGLSASHWVILQPKVKAPKLHDDVEDLLALMEAWAAVDVCRGFVLKL